MLFVFYKCHVNLKVFRLCSSICFRFRHDNGSARLVYNRLHGDGSKVLLDKALDCRVPSNPLNARVGGFFKHTPYEMAGHRIPAKGFHSINSLAIYPLNRGITEHHPDSNVWLDLWSTPNTGSSKYNTDYPEARGRKCIAGVCYRDQPVWLMYR